MEGFVETRDGRRLAYRDAGSGRPVVFIHGWSLSGAIWRPQVDWLVAQGHRAIVYDRRGHGRSDKPATGYDTLADDLAAVLQHADVADATRTMFVAPTTPFALKTADNPEGTDRQVFDQPVAALEADPQGYLTSGAPGLLGNAPSPQAMQWALDIAFQADPQALVKCLRAFSETDFRPDMRAVTTPTLVLYGTGDLPSIASNAKRTAAAIAGSRIEAYEGAPHGLFITDRERFNDDLLRFARS